MKFPTNLSWTTMLFIVVVAGLGALGGLAHFAVAKEDGDVAWKSAITGLVAALGALAFTAMPTTLEQLGESLLIGFFGRAVLDVLQKRVTAAVQADRKEAAKRIADDAIAALQKTDPQHPSAFALRARLDAIH